MDDQSRALRAVFLSHGSTLVRFMHDEMRDAADRNLDPRPHFGLVRHPGNAGLDPALVTRQEFVDFARRHPWRHGDPQALAARIDAQSETRRARVFHHAQRQDTARNLVAPLGFQRRGFFRRASEQRKDHGRDFN